MNTLNKYFVYGTLRPDVEAPWSDLVHRNPQFKLKYYKAYLPYSKMFFNKAIGFAVTIYDKELYSENDRTMGYILETDSPQVTLSVFDEIEKYPEMCDRFEEACYNKENSSYEMVYYYSQKKEFVNSSDLEDFQVNDYMDLVQKTNQAIGKSLPLA
jgi:gamma-glutamylcyclotransferase (GGCT)/AIG2-like uncharacterized protein YtfP